MRSGQLDHRITGSVRLAVTGNRPERLINLALASGLRVWGVSRTGPRRMQVNTDIKGFYALRPLLSRSGCRVRILKKSGLPFLRARVLRRSMLAPGFLLFLALVYALSSFIWVVDIEGFEQVGRSRIEQYLTEQGARPGVRPGALNLRALERGLLLNIPELTWTGLTVRGTRLIVRVAESDSPPDLVPREVPANVCAAQDGYLEELTVLEGRAVVKAGRMVRKGDLLISGLILHENGVVRRVHAEGIAMARVRITVKGEVDIAPWLYVRTGAFATRRLLRVGNREYPLGEQQLYDRFDVVRKEYALAGEFFFYPICLVVETLYETMLDPEGINEPLLQEIARQKAENALLEIEDNATMVDKRIKYAMIGSEKYVAEMTVELRRDIAQTAAA